jgi:hypothetical protein
MHKAAMRASWMRGPMTLEFDQSMKYVPIAFRLGNHYERRRFEPSRYLFASRWWRRRRRENSFVRHDREKLMYARPRQGPRVRRLVRALEYISTPARATDCHDDHPMNNELRRTANRYPLLKGRATRMRGASFVLQAETSPSAVCIRATARNG